jgi:[acyl-carrier-protein] S-malonyltransferase
MSRPHVVLLCPGQGAQAIGMGREWTNAHAASAQTFAAADEAIHFDDNTLLSEICFNGPEDHLNRTDVSQPALFTTAVASFQGLLENWGGAEVVAASGLSLGEYTALHLAGAFSFNEGLHLVATRGRLMQAAAEASDGSMVALIGANEEQAQATCEAAREKDVLVCANFNAPGQIVISGSTAACERAVSVASETGLRASMLKVAGAFHSPLMAPAAEQMKAALAEIDFQPLNCPVWSNVTGLPHEPNNSGLLKQRLVEQLTRPVRWSESCSDLAATLCDSVSQEEPKTVPVVHELAPGKVLKGLFRRVDRSVEVLSHDQPESRPQTPA